MRGKKRKNYPPRKKNKEQRERAIESHSKDKKSSSPGREKSSDAAEKKNSSLGARKKFGQRSKSRNPKSRNRSGGGKFKKTDLDPSMMVNTTIKIKEHKKEVQTRSFGEMDINPQLQSRIKKKGFEKATFMDW